MNDTVKVYVVTCGECKHKQIWDSCTKFRKCSECGANVVLRTISYEELRDIKARAELKTSKLVFSNYMVYSISSEEVEKVVAERKIRIKKEKEDVVDRRTSVQNAVYGNYKRNEKPKAKKRRR